MVAFPLAIILYGNFPNASITVLALAVVATVLVIIVFPAQPEQKKVPIVTQDIELPQNEIFVIRYLRLFFIKFDRFIWNFMIMWMGPFLLVLEIYLEWSPFWNLGKVRTRALTYRCPLLEP